MRAQPEGADDSRPAHPAGALASSHYSVAKLLIDRAGSRWHYEEALRQIQSGIDAGIKDPSGLHLIRGSILFRQRRPWLAVDEYSRALSLRRRAGAPSTQIGEALSELGFAYIFIGRLCRGRRLIEEGVRLLEDAPESGFLHRAQRKLVIANVATGRFRTALSVRQQAQTDATRKAVFDQLRQV